MMSVVDKDIAVLRSQQLPNKLSIAGGGDYDKVWIRDNVYIALALLEAGYVDDAIQIFKELFDIIHTYEPVLDLDKYPETNEELLHPRFTTSGETVEGNWGNKQHDAVGALLFGVGQLYRVCQESVSPLQKRLCQKLITYLENCRYYEDADDGMWEDQPTLHASSLAAAIRGIESVGAFCTHDTAALEAAKTQLERLLPRESDLHDADMALLSLIWPYGYKLPELVEKVESQLLRERGVARFVGDIYESVDGQEPHWVMGVPWLGIAHFEHGNIGKAQAYLQRTEELYLNDTLPESYVAHNDACIHTPLAWSHAMALVLRVKLAHV